MPRQEWGASYQGPLARARVERVLYTCPCGTMFPAEVTVAVNAAEDPDAGGRARAGALNTATCPDCARTSPVEVPVVVHDDDQATFVLVLPASARHRELEERARLLAQLTAGAVSVPRYVREFQVAWVDGLRVDLRASDAASAASRAPTPRPTSDPSELQRAATEILRAREARVQAAAAADAAVTGAIAKKSDVAPAKKESDEHDRETGPFNRVDLDAVESEIVGNPEAAAAAPTNGRTFSDRAITERPTANDRPATGPGPAAGGERVSILERLAAAADRLAPDRSAPQAERGAANGGVTMAVAGASVARPAASTRRSEPAPPIDVEQLAAAAASSQKTVQVPVPTGALAARAAVLAAGAAAAASALLTSEQAADASGVISSTSSLGRGAAARAAAAATPSATRSFDNARTVVAPLVPKRATTSAPLPTKEEQLELESATLDELLVLLEDPNRRGQVAIELARRGDPQVVEPLFAALRRMTRGEAVRVLPVLVKLGEPAVLHLVAGLRSRKSFLRQGCALALGVTRNAAAIEPLAELLVWEPTDVWREVARALGELGVGAVNPLVQLVDRAPEPGSEITLEQRADRIVWALAHIVARGGRAPVEVLSESSNSRHAALAKDALELTATAKSNDAEVRQDLTPRDQTVNRAFSRRFFEAMSGRVSTAAAAAGAGDEPELIEAELDELLDPDDPNDGGEILGDDDLMPG